MPRSPQPPPPPNEQDTEPNEFHVVDYNRTFLKPIIDQLEEGDTCTIQVTGTVTNTNEVDTGDGTYMCELNMEPTKARLVNSGGGGGGGGTMASQMKRDQQKRAGQELDTEEY
jgi:hypothetical protein